MSKKTDRDSAQGLDLPITTHEIRKKQFNLTEVRIVQIKFCTPTL